MAKSDLLNVQVEGNVFEGKADELAKLLEEGGKTVDAQGNADLWQWSISSNNKLIINEIFRSNEAWLGHIEGFFQPFAAAFFARNIGLNFFQQRVLSITVFAKFSLARGEIRTVFHATGTHPIEELLQALRIVFSRIVSRGFLRHSRSRHEGRHQQRGAERKGNKRRGEK